VSGNVLSGTGAVFGVLECVYGFLQYDEKQGGVAVLYDCCGAVGDCGGWVCEKN
jgi:hypothetical protein